MPSLSPLRGRANLARSDYLFGGYVKIMFRIPTIIFVIWFAIGALAAWQRDYFKDDVHTCAKAGTIAATIAAGPLNYVGVNPKIKCSLPQPSK